MEEHCQNCIHWDGDNSGMLGYCNVDYEKDNILVVVGRFENCIHFLARKLETGHEQNK